VYGAQDKQGYVERFEFPESVTVELECIRVTKSFVHAILILRTQCLDKLPRRLICELPLGRNWTYFANEISQEPHGDWGFGLRIFFGLIVAFGQSEFLLIRVHLTLAWGVSRHVKTNFII
jgi:hypothetical protein